MLGSDSEANHASRQIAQRRKVLRYLEDDGRVHLGRAGQDPGDDGILDEDLELLGRTGREIAPSLDLVQVLQRHRAAAQARGQNVGGRDRILDGKVHTDAADRRHCMIGIADAEQAGPGPFLDTIDRHGEKLDVVPARDRVDTAGRQRQDGRQRLPKGR